MGSGVKRTDSEFVALAKKTRPEFTVISSYVDVKTKVLIKDSDGVIYSVRPQDFLLGKKPSLQVALDKYEAFKTLAQKVHGTKYSYPAFTYENAKSKIQALCPIHGHFQTCYDLHISRGRGCQECGKESALKTKRASGNQGGWSVSSWSELEFSPKFKGFELYLILCYNETERFLKIGRTCKGVKKRFEDKNKMPYKTETIFTRKGSAEDIHFKEKLFKKIMKPFQYSPKIGFNGKTECFFLSDRDIEDFKNFIKQY